MGIKYLWDTNTVVYFLLQEFPPNAEKYIDNLLIDGYPIISVITEIELLCWITKTKKDATLVKDFINDSTIIELDASIKLKQEKLESPPK